MSSKEQTGEKPADDSAQTPAKQGTSLQVSTPEDDPFVDPAFSHLPELKVSDLHFRPQRRTLLPILLFVATCMSTFWVGCTEWQPLEERYIFSYQAMWAVISINWATGLRYMVAVLAILLTHEMGHFIATVKHRITASYPLCIPIPFNAIGTMGAVIGMDGTKADRRQIFDIGIAGPLAGLVVAIPVFWLAFRNLIFRASPIATKSNSTCPRSDNGCSKGPTQNGLAGIGLVCRN